MNIPAISIPFFATGLGALALAVHAWRQRQTVGAQIFSSFLVSIAIYSTGYAMELSTEQLATALFWNQVQYIGTLSFPALYLLFVYLYIGRLDWFNPSAAFLAFLPAMLFFGVKLMDQNLEWIYAAVEMVEVNGRMLMSFEEGPLYPYVSVYQVFVVTLATMLLMQKRRHASELFLRQTGIILSGAAVVFFVYFTYLLEITLHPALEGIDLTPLSFGVLAITIAIAIFRYGFLDVVPVARDALIEALSDGAIILDAEARVVDANPVAQALLGWKTVPFGAAAVKILSPKIELVLPTQKDEPARQEIRLGDSAVPRYYEVTISSLGDSRGRALGYLVYIHDITQRKRAEQELEELSLTDELTGLHNRRGFMMLAGQMLEMAARTGMRASLFYCDIDGLKEINDNLGHAAGDRALKDVANIFRASFRASDVIARMGGDEFALLGVEASDHQSISPVEERLERNTREYARQQKDFKLEFSIGVARFDPDKPQTLTELLQEADLAMYAVKQRKKRRAAAPA